MPVKKNAISRAFFFVSIGFIISVYRQFQYFYESEIRQQQPQQPQTQQWDSSHPRTMSTRTTTIKSSSSTTTTNKGKNNMPRKSNKEELMQAFLEGGESLQHSHHHHHPTTTNDNNNNNDNNNKKTKGPIMSRQKEGKLLDNINNSHDIFSNPPTKKKRKKQTEINKKEQEDDDNNNNHDVKQQYTFIQKFYQNRQSHNYTCSDGPPEILVPQRLKPKLVKLDRRDYRVLHVGKAGGGSISIRLGLYWRIQMASVHPTPNKLYFYNNKEDNQKKDNDTGNNIHEYKDTIPWTLISIRDPVDRAVSAYYWRSLILCHPQNEHRPVGPATKDPIKYCKKAESEEEVRVLFEDYEERNINAIAERLCHSDDDNNDEEVTQKARRDLRYIQHLEHQIAGTGQWLPFLMTTNNKNNTSTSDWMERFAPRIFPIVMEKPYTLELQIDAAVQWFFDNNAFEDATTYYDIRKPWVQLKDKSSNCTYGKNGDGSKNETIIPVVNDNTNNNTNVDIQTMDSRRRRLLEQQQKQDLPSIYDHDTNKANNVKKIKKGAKMFMKRPFDLDDESNNNNNNNNNNHQFAAAAAAKRKNKKKKPHFAASIMTTDDVKQKRHFHSSSAHPNRTNPVLSERGEYCLTQYYQKDYDALAILLNHSVCKTRECQDSLERILSRRRILLEE